ncbi:MAG: hypothetical protein AVO35_05090 [Candidatus Aegiribacteria sp. MLS_C]|nr:MAG: hypothetical protein AVO35_05090 [Candidatus Aegiribacteria sp. MLS_C]
MDSSTGRLEFGKVLESVAAGTHSHAGRSRVMALEPGWTRERSSELARETLDAVSLISLGMGVPAAGLDELIGICDQLEDGALVLEPRQLRDAGEALSLQRSFADLLAARSEETGDLSGLAGYLERVSVVPGIGTHLVSLTTPDGELSPAATREYERLTRRVEDLKRKLSSRIGRISSSLSGGGVLRDMPPTIRDGRYVLPVVSSRKGDVRGIVHDRSESGETVFIEPAELVEDGNALREASLDLDYERRRILREATMDLRRVLPLVLGSVDAVAGLDAVYARAVYHQRTGSVFPEEGRLCLRDLGHPLIRSDEMVRNTIELPEDWRVLIVSGPNAGGKSVLLKSVGLSVACAHSGLGCLAGPGSSMPFFGRLHVSIGDQQSIFQHQSTYSARLQEQLEMMRAPGDGSLALIDEPSAGTDPLTGAALAASVLERLAGSGCRVIVTTHQGQLKSLAQGREGFYSGSMNFRKETLEPDYTFVAGMPGSSFTLEIARRMEFPVEVLSRAQELAGDSFRLDRLLEEVTSARKELCEGIELLQEETERSREQVARRVRELEEEKREFQKNRDRMIEELAGLGRDINSRADSLLGRLARTESREERKQLREKIREISARMETPGWNGCRGEESAEGLREGDWVGVIGWSGPGRIEEVGEDHVTVTMGNLRLRKSTDQVTRVEPPDEKPPSAGWSCPVDAETELDLRGLSADEALVELDRAVEEGLAAGIPFIRVIHGKGKGILMKAVIDSVRSDRRIGSFRPGLPSEGGIGVTIIYPGRGGGKV